MLLMGFIWEVMEFVKLANNCLALIAIPAIKVAVWLALHPKFWIKRQVTIVHSLQETKHASVAPSFRTASIALLAQFVALVVPHFTLTTPHVTFSLL
jgi:hypothetical protein